MILIEVTDATVHLAHVGSPAVMPDQDLGKVSSRLEQKDTWGFVIDDWVLTARPACALEEVVLEVAMRVAGVVKKARPPGDILTAEGAG